MKNDQILILNQVQVEQLYIHLALVKVQQVFVDRKSNSKQVESPTASWQVDDPTASW